jgi:hypothetical protein
VAVEVLAGTVVTHGGAEVGVAGGDLDIAKADAASSMVVTKVCRSMCGCIRGIRIPALAASRLRRRVAACRSRRRPGVFRKIGALALVDRALDGAGNRGR